METNNIGYIYCLTSPFTQDGLLKIGATRGNPIERARQLSNSTSAALPFTLAYSRRVNNPFEVEAALHRALAQYRVNDSREFFNVPIYKVIGLLEQYDEVPEMMWEPVETPYAELFAKFPDEDGAARELTTDEQLACLRLKQNLGKPKRSN